MKDSFIESLVDARQKTWNQYTPSEALVKLDELGVTINQLDSPITRDIISGVDGLDELDTEELDLVDLADDSLSRSTREVLEEIRKALSEQDVIGCLLALLSCPLVETRYWQQTSSTLKGSLEYLVGCNGFCFDVDSAVLGLGFL